MISLHFSDSQLEESQKVAARQKLLAEECQLEANQFGTLFSDSLSFDVDQVAQKNCQNLVGQVAVPVGVTGPVEIHFNEIKDGSAAKAANVEPLAEEWFLPLATTEGALVASTQRGCKVLNQSGGVKVFVRNVGITRAPVFGCKDGASAIDFRNWITNNFAQLQTLCQSTSAHLTLKEHQAWVRGRNVYVRFVFDTDQAMGMNMATIAIDYVWKEISKLHPDVKMVAISSNVCSDKKDSVINRLYGRGYWVQAEVLIPFEVIKNVLKVKPSALIETHVAKNLVGSNMAGSFSQNMQVGNLVAALFLATGQDLAHVTEASQASTSFEMTEDGVYAAVTLPDMPVGVVGGGTWLPAQSEARRLIHKGKDLTATQLAAAVGVAALAAEISGMAAITSQTLASAHLAYGRSTTDSQKSQL